MKVLIVSGVIIIILLVVMCIIFADCKNMLFKEPIEKFKIHDKLSNIELLCLILVLLSMFFGALTNSYFNNSTPKAIDVYRGKTTLKITYVDSIPQDTVIVFKNKLQNK